MAAPVNQVTLKRSFKALVIFSLVTTGLAGVCAAASLMCLHSLTVLSIAPALSDRPTAEARLASAPPLLWNDFWNEATASLGSIPGGRQKTIASIGPEFRLPVPRPLLRGDLRSRPATGLASVRIEAQPAVQFIRFDVPTLAPMAFTQFCLKYPADCKSQRLPFAGDRVELSDVRRSELETVNRTVNSSIRPERNEDGLAAEKWLLAPTRGDCNDYAVTKRHQLIARGWPARTVLLSEVATASGEHHLVTVVRTTGGDLVLDNLSEQIMPWSRTPYRWVRMQTPKNPNYWAAISRHSA